MHDELKKLDSQTRRDFVSNLARTCLGVSVAPALLSTRVAAAAEKAKAKSVIYLYMAGGMSHLDSFDPKPGVEQQGPTKSIKTKSPGVLLGEHLPKLANMTNRVTLVRSMTSTQGAHAPGSYLAHTSYTPRATIRHPALGAWILESAGRVNPNIPGNIVISGGSDHPGAGFMDLKYAPLPIGNPAGGLPNSSLPRGVSDKEFNMRLSLVSRFGERFLKLYPQKQVKGYGEMYVDAIRLMRSEDVKAFDISLEKKPVRDAYGDDNFGKGCLLARRLIESDVRFVEVGFNGWDTHVDNFESLADKLPVLDKAVTALLNDLQQRGLLKDTLVVLTSEFGRSPKINDRVGRDHHPAAYTSMLAGGGVKAGYVHGGTDEKGHFVIDSEATVPDFNATIAHAMGLSLTKKLISASGRPFTVADEGEVIEDVFA